MKYIMYCAVRKEAYIYQCIYSIASLNSIFHEKKFSIVILTDMPEILYRELKKVPEALKNNVIVESLTPQQVIEWVGSNQYIFKVKIKALQYFMTRYKDDVLFVDCDMYAKQNSALLFDQIHINSFLMYAQYNESIRQLVTKDYPNLINNQNAKCQVREDKLIIRNGSFNIELDLRDHITLSCNLGLAYENLDILDEVVDYCDGIYDITGIYNSEEIAFQLVMEKHGMIQLTQDYFWTSKSSEWIRLLAGWLFGFFVADDADQYNRTFSYSLNMLFTKKLHYDFDTLRYMMNIAMVLQVGLNVEYTTVCSYGLRSMFLKNTKEEKESLKDFFIKHKLPMDNKI